MPLFPERNAISNISLARSTAPTSFACDVGFSLAHRNSRKTALGSRPFVPKRRSTVERRELVPIQFCSDRRSTATRPSLGKQGDEWAVRPQLLKLGPCGFSKTRSGHSRTGSRWRASHQTQAWPGTRQDLTQSAKARSRPPTDAGGRE